MHIFIVYTKILILNELRGYQRNRPYLYVLFAMNYILAPLFLGGLLAFFVKNVSIIYISFFIFLTTIHLDKSLMRILFSSDKKQMAILKLNMDQYIFGKDMSKFFGVMIGFICFFLGSFWMTLNTHALYHSFILGALGISSLLFGYLLRLNLLLLLTRPRVFSITPMIQYITTGVIASWMFFVFKFELFSIPFSNQLVLTLAALIFLTSLILLINWKKNLRYTPIFHSEEKDRHHQNTTSRSFDHILFFEITLLLRNPPIQWSVLLFILTISGGLFTLILYGVHTNQIETLNIENDFLFIFSVIFPMIFISNALQSYVSFDVDGPIIPLKHRLPHFIKNKINSKLILSVLLHMFFCTVYTIFSTFTINVDHPFYVIFTLLVSSVLIGVCTVGSTVLFPYFKWEYVYQVPSTLSKLTLNLCFSFILGLSVMSSYNLASFIAANTIMIVCTVIIIVIMFLFWDKTINKNCKSVKTLFE